MRAMILAAGRGDRMRPLTDQTPKPLLEVQGKPLIEHHIERLVEAGCDQLVINVSWLGDQIVEKLGDGSRWGVTIDYSPEEERLETAGGIARALPMLGEEPFLVVNADIWCDFPFARLISDGLSGGDLAHLVLVPNPEQKPVGDFELDSADKVIELDQTKGYTFSGIGLYAPALFSDLPAERYPLRPILVDAMANQQVSGELYSGEWQDIGTPERLTAINES